MERRKAELQISTQIIHAPFCTAQVIGREVSNELGCQSTDIYYMKPSVLIRDHSFVMFRQEGLSLQTKNKRIYSAIYNIAITALLSDEFVIANAGVDVELRYGLYRCELDAIL